MWIKYGFMIFANHSIGFVYLRHWTYLSMDVVQILISVLLVNSMGLIQKLTKIIWKRKHTVNRDDKYFFLFRLRYEMIINPF